MPPPSPLYKPSCMHDCVDWATSSLLGKVILHQQGDFTTARFFCANKVLVNPPQPHHPGSCWCTSAGPESSSNSSRHLQPYSCASGGVHRRCKETSASLRTKQPRAPESAGSPPHDQEKDLRCREPASAGPLLLFPTEPKASAAASCSGLPNACRRPGTKSQAREGRCEGPSSTRRPPGALTACRFREPLEHHSHMPELKPEQAPVSVRAPLTQARTEAQISDACGK
eukprot:1156123-Pelagomonas_calceolata.AAC.4